MDTKNKKTKKIRTGDKVVVLSGNDKGQTGTVLSWHGDKVIVQGINVKTKHQRPRRQGEKGAVVKIERPMDPSNLRVCDAAGNPVKLKTQTDQSGHRQFVYEADGKTQVYRPVKKPK